MGLNKRTLYLHIGTEKTGSKSIQSFLRLNRSRLAKKGIGVPTKLGLEMHLYLQLMANEDDFIDSFTMNLELNQDKNERSKQTERWKADFFEEVRNSPLETWIISCETLHSRLLQASELNRLKTILREIFDTIHVVVYLREPLSLAVSRLNELAKAAVKLDIPEPSHQTKFDIANHEQTVKRWLHAMGKGDLIIRLFEPESLMGGDVITDFLNACQISLSDYTKPKHRNGSMSKTGLLLLNEVNRYVPRRWVNTKLIPSRSMLVKHFEKSMKKGKRYWPSPNEIDHYQKHYKEPNEWVRSRFFPERNELFTPRWQEATVDEQQVFNEEDLEQIGALIANIWLIKNAQIHLRDARIKRLEAQCKAHGLAIDVNSDSHESWVNYIER